MSVPVISACEVMCETSAESGRVAGFRSDTAVDCVMCIECLCTCSFRLCEGD